MATLTWVGGGNNKADNSQDWSPAQVPAAGDTLIMPDGTMNVSDNDLAGNTLQVGSGQSSSSPTTSNINLSHHADVSISQPLVTNAGDFVTNIDAKGSNTLNLDAPTGSAPINVRTFDVDIQSGALTASFTTDYSTIAINGNGKLINDASTIAGSSAVIDTDVVGQGSFDVTALPTFGGVVDDGSLEFGGKVGRSETITVGHTITSAALQWDTVKIDEPKDFHGSVIMQPSAEVDLVGLGNADSYRIQDDKLQFISDNHVIDSLKLTNESSADLVVSTDGNDAYVTQGGLSNPPPGSTTLPQATVADFAPDPGSDAVQGNSHITDSSALSSYLGVPDSGIHTHLMHVFHS